MAKWTPVDYGGARSPDPAMDTERAYFPAPGGSGTNLTHPLTLLLKGAGALSDVMNAPQIRTRLPHVDIEYAPGAQPQMPPDPMVPPVVQPSPAMPSAIPTPRAAPPVPTVGPEIPAVNDGLFGQFIRAGMRSIPGLAPAEQDRLADIFRLYADKAWRDGTLAGAAVTNIESGVNESPEALRRLPPGSSPYLGFTPPRRPGEENYMSFRPPEVRDRIAQRSAATKAEYENERAVKDAQTKALGPLTPVEQVMSIFSSMIGGAASPESAIGPTRAAYSGANTLGKMALGAGTNAAVVAPSDLIAQDAAVARGDRKDINLGETALATGGAAALGALIPGIAALFRRAGALRPGEAAAPPPRDAGPTALDGEIIPPAPPGTPRLAPPEPGQPVRSPDMPDTRVRLRDAPAELPAPVRQIEGQRALPAPEQPARPVDVNRQITNTEPPARPAEPATGPAIGRPRAQPEVPPKAQETAAPAMPESAKEPAAFQTAKGSTYTVHEDGTTTRVKAARPEHPGDSGPKARSEKTVYMSPQDAALINPNGITGKTRVVDMNDGSVALVTWNEKLGKWGLTPSGRSKYETAPREGLAPVELWKPEPGPGGRKMYSATHVGNKIVPSTPAPSRSSLDNQGTVGEKAGMQQAPDVPQTQLRGHRTSSWVIRNKETGDVVFETFDPKKVQALNTAKYEAIPVGEHLASLNRTPKESSQISRNDSPINETIQPTRAEQPPDVPDFLKRTPNPMKEKPDAPAPPVEKPPQDRPSEALSLQGQGRVQDDARRIDSGRQGDDGAVGGGQRAARPDVRVGPEPPAPKAEATKKPRVTRGLANKPIAEQAAHHRATNPRTYANNGPNTEKALAEYFTPGRIVKSYAGGKDRVIGFDWNGGRWSARVEAVNPKTGEAIKPGETLGRAGERAHATAPTWKEVDASLRDPLNAPKSPDVDAPAVEPWMHANINKRIEEGGGWGRKHPNDEPLIERGLLEEDGGYVRWSKDPQKTRADMEARLEKSRAEDARADAELAASKKKPAHPFSKDSKPTEMNLGLPIRAAAAKAVGPEAIGALVVGGYDHWQKYGYPGLTTRGMIAGAAAVAAIRHRMPGLSKPVFGKASYAKDALGAVGDAIGRTRAGRWFHPTMGLPKDLWDRIVVQTGVETRNIQEAAKAVAKHIRDNFTPAERALMSDWIERAEQQAAGMNAFRAADARTRAKADELSAKADEIGQRLVDVGMLDQRSYDALKGAYLHRYYLPKQAADPGFREAAKRMQATATYAMRRGESAEFDGKNFKVGDTAVQWTHAGTGNVRYEKHGWNGSADWFPSKEFKVEAVKDGRAIGHRDYTPAEREAMGEIRDANYRYTMGMMEAARDVALGSMFKDLANNPKWAGNIKHPGWVQVPGTSAPGTSVKKFGALAGMYVKPEVWDALKVVRKPWTNTDSEAWNNLARSYTKLLGLWKIGKTAYNPATHFNNLMGNTSLSMLTGEVTPAYLMRGIGELRKMKRGGSSVVDEAKAAGLSLDREAHLGDAIDNLKADVGLTTGMDPRTGWAKFADWFTNNGIVRAYQYEDSIFKLGSYMKNRAEGLSPKDAVAKTHKVFFDYSDVPLGVQAVRDTYSPFFTYTYKYGQLLANIVAEKPWALLAAFGTLEAARQMSYYHLYGERAKANADYEAELMPKWLEGRSGFGAPKGIRLPWNERDAVTGDPRSQFLNTRYMVPGGDFLDFTANGSFGPPVFPQMLGNTILGGNPLVNFAYSVLSGKDSYFDKSIYPYKDPVNAGELVADAATIIRFAAAQALPPILMSVPDKLGNAAVGEGALDKSWMTEAMGWTGTDFAGRQRSVIRAIGSALGIKVEDVNTTENLDFKEAEAKKADRDANTEVRRAYNNESVTETRRQNLEKSAEDRAVKSDAELDRIYKLKKEAGR